MGQKCWAYMLNKSIPIDRIIGAIRCFEMVKLAADSIERSANVLWKNWDEGAKNSVTEEWDGYAAMVGDSL